MSGAQPINSLIRRHHLGELVYSFDRRNGSVSDHLIFRSITESWDHALSEAMAIQQERLASAISFAEISRCEAQNRISALIKKRSHRVDNFLRPTLQSELKQTKRLRSVVSFSRITLKSSTKDTSLLDRVEVIFLIVVIVLLSLDIAGACPISNVTSTRTAGQLRTRSRIPASNSD